MDKNLKFIDKIEKIKFFMKLHTIETIKLLENIDNNNAEIKEDRIITKLNEYPFREEEETLCFLDPVKKTFAIGVVNTNIIDGVSPIISLISLENKANNKINSLLSLQILPNLDIGTIYINYNILKHLSFNEYTKLKLMKIENLSNISKVLNLFREGLVGNGIFKDRFSFDNFEEMSIENKLSKIKSILDTLFSGKYKVMPNFSIFKSGDLNLNIYTKKDYLEILNNIEQQNIINTFNFLRFYDTETARNFYQNNLFHINNERIIKENKDKKFTASQKLSIINSSNEQFSIINGIAGSGKTEVAIELIINNLYLNAVSKANFNKNINFLFTTYNKKALIDFKERFKNYGIENLLFINEELDSNFNNILENLIYQLENVNEFTNLDKFNQIEKKLQEDFPETKKIIEIYLKIKELKDIFSKKTLTNKKYPYMVKLERIFRDNINISGFENFFHNLGFKIKKKPINISKNIVEKLKGVIKFGNNNKDFNINQFLASKLLYKIEKLKKIANSKDEFNEKEISKYLQKIELEYENLNKIKKETSVLDFEDIVFYLSKYYYKDKDYNLKLLKYLKLQTNSKSNQMDLDTLQQMLKKEDKDIVTEIFNIFPVHLSIVSKLGKTYPLKEYFDLTVIDEAFQTPGYFFSSILSRSNNIIGVGDNGQLENSNLYNKLTENSLYNSIYSLKESFLLKNMLIEQDIDLSQEELIDFYQKYGTSRMDNNIFNLLKQVGGKTNNVLIDNFRSNKEIVNAFLFTSFKYKNIIKSFLIKNKDKLENKNRENFLQEELQNWDEKNSIYKFVNTYIKNTDVFYTLNNREIANASLFYCNTNYINGINEEEIISSIFKILKFISLQKTQFGANFSGNDILFITPFKQDSNKINEILTNSKNEYPELINGIICESVENIQGIERKVVIFDSGIYNEQSEQINFITEKPEILTVAISRAKHLFIFLGNVNLINEKGNQNILNQLLNENNLFQFYNIE